MLLQNSRIKFALVAPLFFVTLTLLAVGCDNSNPSDMQRPAENSGSNQHMSGTVVGTEINRLPKKIIQVSGKNIEVEIADTDSTREQGLSNRATLDDGTGMLFDFTNTDYYKPGFWMKDMLISIDMVWIKDEKIIGIEPNVPLPPQSDLPLYYPPSEITHVLEVPAGWSARNNVKIGDTLQL